MSEKVIIGLIEEVIIRGNGQERIVRARIDTGAAYSSVDTHLAAELQLGPIAEVKTIKSANGNRVRAAIRTEVEIKGKKYAATLTLADRSHMKYDILIGRDVLMQGFLIDPKKEV